MLGSPRRRGGRRIGERAAHHPSRVRRQRDLAVAEGQLERFLRDLARLGVERDVDAIAGRAGELVRRVLEQARVLLGAPDERPEIALERLEVEPLRAAAVRGKAGKRGRELDGKLGDPIVRERAQQSVHEAVHRALYRRIVSTIAEHRADCLHEISLDLHPFLAATLGDVKEAAGQAVDAHRVHTHAGLDELRYELRRDRDERSLLGRLEREGQARRGDLLLGKHRLRPAPDVLGQRVARDHGHLARPLEDPPGAHPTRSRSHVGNETRAVILADVDGAGQHKRRGRHGCVAGYHGNPGRDLARWSAAPTRPGRGRGGAGKPAAPRPTSHGGETGPARRSPARSPARTSRRPISPAHLAGRPLVEITGLGDGDEQCG